MSKVAIVVGHRAGSQGACNAASGCTEYEFNQRLAIDIAHTLHDANIIPIIIYRDTYAELPNQVNATNCDICVSLHCNAFDTKTAGAETLCYVHSKQGESLAKSIQSQVVDVMQESDRGIKKIDHNHIGGHGDRGGWLVKKTAMPCVIVEPFFIDNDASFTLASERSTALADAIAAGIIASVGGDECLDG